jgi:hypothetical protein
MISYGVLLTTMRRPATAGSALRVCRQKLSDRTTTASRPDV